MGVCVCTENSAGNRAGGKWEHKRDALQLLERMQRRRRQRQRGAILLATSS